MWARKGASDRGVICLGWGVRGSSGRAGGQGGGDRLHILGGFLTPVFMPFEGGMLVWDSIQECRPVQDEQGETATEGCVEGEGGGGGGGLQSMGLTSLGRV